MSLKLSRRELLKSSSVVAVPCLIAGRHAIADEEKSAAKNDRPILGAIGVGGQGRHDSRRAKEFGDFAAICDVDRAHAEQANQELAAGKAELYGDYRKLLERKDVEAVIIATPDHWHTKIAIEAMQAGKDVYCEKPLTLTIDEGKQICQVAKATQRVFQVGTQQRSENNDMFLKAAALCQDGRLGKIQRVTAIIGGAPAGGPFAVSTPPATLDWNVWQGQVETTDYIKERCHGNFRWWYEYSGGKMTDWGAHHVDIAHWVLGASNTGPVSVEGTANHPVPFKDGYPTETNKYNTATDFVVTCKFADDIELIITDKTPEHDNGVLVEGEKGRMFVNRGKLTGKPVEDLASNPLPASLLSELYKGKRTGNHMRNFIECVKDRGEPVSDVFSHHRALTTCHLANIAIRLGRRLNWNPETEQIVGDEAANTWLSREQRKGFEIVV
ncbi:MAG: Gfo/Idh/MocA family oxidoreductase [Planctomycetes bacterium]|nr:Gfo/Idh/MocA family oxidoreductase [Planctomycetota bacterium]